jgi:hypothetical protein
VNICQKAIQIVTYPVSSDQVLPTVEASVSRLNMQDEEARLATTYDTAKLEANDFNPW